MRVLAIVFWVILSGCNSADNSYSNDHVFKLSPKGEFTSAELNAPMSAIFGFGIGLVNLNGQEFFYYLSKKDTAVYLHNCRDSTDSKKVFVNHVLGKRIPFARSEITGIYYENEDKLWIDSPTSDSLFCLNPIGVESVKGFKVELTDQNEEERTRRLRLNPYTNTLISSSSMDSKFNIVYHYYSEKDKSGQIPTSFPVLGEFLEEDRIWRLKQYWGALPDNYHKTNMYINFCTTMPVGKDSILINYPFSDFCDLFVGNGEVQRFEMKSKYSKGFAGLSGSPHDMMAIKKFFLMHPRYDHVMYDAYRKLYYRVFIHEGDNKDQPGKIVSSKQWSLVVFDKQMRRKHEKTFNSLEYDPGMLFVIKEGVLIRSFAKHKKRSELSDPLKVYFELFVPVEV